MTPDTIVIVSILSGASLVVALVTLLLVWQSRAMSEAQLTLLFRNEVERLRQGSDEQAHALRQEINDGSKRFHDGVLQAFKALGDPLVGQVKDIDERLKERLDVVGAALSSLTDKQEKAQEALRVAVESRLDAIRNENAAKLDEMRKTVDEKLQATLETRLGDSFNRVVEQLERVHKGIGEMKTLADGVGDLKKILSNVRARGAFGEMQLATLIDQFLSVEQVKKNAEVKPGSQERVEFAIRLPGRDEFSEVLLPIDAKFPQEDYEKLIIAAEAGDAAGVAEASKALETRVRGFAKDIQSKYINPPITTDFAILFLPTESLYAELLRRPGLFEQIQREYHVTLTGPTTFTSLLNALQMGFQTLALERRSSEVWHVLRAVKTEFSKYNLAVDRLATQLGTAARSVDKLGTRTRAMNRKLQDVQKLSDEDALALLGPAFDRGNEDDADEATETDTDDSTS